jgi:hypothetical protein
MMRATVLILFALGCGGDETSCAPGKNPDGTLELATAQGQPIGLTVAGDQIFWANTGSGAILGAPKRGGCTRTVAQDSPGPVAIAVSQTHIWWANVMDGAIRRVPLTGGSIETVAVGQDHPEGIAVSGETAFWMDHGTSSTLGSLMRWQSGDPSPSTLAPSLHAPGGIVADASGVYWGAEGTLWTAPVTGGTPMMLFPQQAGAGSPSAIVIANGFAYFLQGSTLGVISVSGNGQWFMGTPVIFTGLVMRGQTLFFMASLKGSLFAVDASQLTQFQMPHETITGLPQPSALTGDADALYWIEGGFQNAGAVVSYVP